MLFMIEFNSNSGYIQNWILLNVFTVKQSEINKEKKNSLLLLLQIIQQVSGTGSKLTTWGSYFPSWWKCIFLWSIWSWSLSGTGCWPGQTLSLMQDGRSSAQLSNVCMKKSWWNKQVSSGNAFPPAKDILHFDDIHDSISVLQTCFLPTEYDVFSKSCKTNSVYLERKNTQRSQ